MSSTVGWKRYKMDQNSKLIQGDRHEFISKLWRLFIMMRVWSIKSLPSYSFSFQFHREINVSIIIWTFYLFSSFVRKFCAFIFCWRVLMCLNGHSIVLSIDIDVLLLLFRHCKSPCHFLVWNLDLRLGWRPINFSSNIIKISPRFWIYFQ